MSELIFLFTARDENDLLGQLNNDIKWLKDRPSLIICTKKNWTLLEQELQPIVSARYNTLKIKGYDKVTNDSITSVSAEDKRYGFICIPYINIPIIAMNDNEDNIIGARLHG